MDRDVVARLLSDMGIRPSRRRGQTFLLAEGLARRQVAYAVEPGRRVLEIGPGLGILTEAIYGVTDKVVAIEQDRRLCRYLREKFPGLDLIEGDALRVPLPDFDAVVSNLPYRISSSVTFRLLRRPFQTACLMYQAEFANRLVAETGTSEYSRLTVHVRHRARAEILETVPKDRFHPIPEVESAVVRLEPRAPEYEVVDEAVFTAVIDAAFSHRRKKIENAVKAHWDRFIALGCEGSEAPKIPYGERRPQELSPEEFAAVANRIATTKP